MPPSQLRLGTVLPINASEVALLQPASIVSTLARDIKLVGTIPYFLAASHRNCDYIHLCTYPMIS